MKNLYGVHRCGSFFISRNGKYFTSTVFLCRSNQLRLDKLSVNIQNSDMLSNILISKQLQLE